MHEVLVNYLFKLAQEKNVVRLTDRPAMTIAVDLGRKATKQPIKTISFQFLKVCCFCSLELSRGGNSFNHNSLSKEILKKQYMSLSYPKLLLLYEVRWNRSVNKFKSLSIHNSD